MIAITTGVDLDTLKKVGDAITTLPESVTPHRMVGKIYQARQAAITSGKGIDWAVVTRRSEAEPARSRAPSLALSPCLRALVAFRRASNSLGAR